MSYAESRNFFAELVVEELRGPMQAIGYRRFLPAIVLLTIGTLLFVEMLERRIVRSQRTPNLHEQSALTAPAPIITSYEVPVAVGVVTTLAAPGLLPFTLLGYTPLGTDIRSPLFLSVIALVTAFVWYAAGRWIDRRLGYVPWRPATRGPIQQVMNLALLFAWIAAVSTITAELIAIDFMEVLRWMAAGVAGWGVFVSIVLIYRIRDYRRSSRDVATAERARA
jgi:hypothetical protein